MWWNWFFPAASLVGLGLTAYGASRPYRLEVSSTPPQIIPAQPVPPPEGWGPIVVREPETVPSVTVPGRWWNPETGEWHSLEGTSPEAIMAAYQQRQAERQQQQAAYQQQWNAWQQQFAEWQRQQAAALSPRTLPQTWAPTPPTPTFEVPTVRWQAPELGPWVDPMRRAWLDLQSRAGWGAGGAFSPTIVASQLGLWEDLYPADVWASFLRRALD